MRETMAQIVHEAALPLVTLAVGSMMEEFFFPGVVTRWVSLPLLVLLTLPIGTIGLCLPPARVHAAKRRVFSTALFVGGALSIAYRALGNDLRFLSAIAFATLAVAWFVFPSSLPDTPEHAEQRGPPPAL